MSTIDDGGPAFPRPQAQTREGWQPGHPGMSLRDYFAGQSLTLVAAILNEGDSNPTTDRIAAEAYRMADAMLAARKA